MIAKFFIIPLVVVVSAPSFGQSAARHSDSSRADSVKQSLLAEIPGGATLYAQSREFRNAIMLKTAMQLSEIRSDSSNASAHSFQSLSEDTIAIEDEAQWQNTTAVAVNRKNSNQIAVAAWDDLAWNHRLGQAVYVSDDAGQTWNTQRLPRILHAMTFGEPSLASDAEGQFFCSHTLLTNGECIAVAVSPDGYDWKNALVSNDTNGEGADAGSCVAVDLSPQSPHFDRVYVAWSHFDTLSARSGIQLIWSDDHGKTWTSPKYVDSNGSSIQIRFGTKGEICVLYNVFDAKQYILAVSTDGGSTFARHAVASYMEYPEVILQTPFFDDTTVGLKGKNGFGAVAFAACSMEQYDRLNLVFATWDSMHRCAELFAKHSTDFGATWSDSAMISSAGTPYFDRFYPSLSHDAVSGSTTLTYYSSEFDTANLGTTVVSKVMAEPGWAGNHALDSYPFDPLNCSANLETSIGEYIGSDENNSVFAAAWTADKAGPFVIVPGQTDGRSDVMVYVSSPTSSGVGPVKVNPDRLYLSAPFPNPVMSGTAKINIVSPQTHQATLSLFDPTGKYVKQVFAGTLAQGSYIESLDLFGVLAGNYVLVLQSGSENVSQKIVIDRGY